VIRYLLSSGAAFRAPAAVRVIMCYSNIVL